jgi:hypothetical protein
MSSSFVRYSPEVEAFDPKLSEYMTRIIEFWEKKVRESPATEGSGRAVRGAHAKTLGVIRAEVEMIGNAPAPYAQGIYATPGRHDALIRFSSASNHLGPDAALGPVLGFAIKIFDVGGTKPDRKRLLQAHRHSRPDAIRRLTRCPTPAPARATPAVSGRPAEPSGPVRRAAR